MRKYILILSFIFFGSVSFAKDSQSYTDAQLFSFLQDLINDEGPACLEQAFEPKEINVSKENVVAKERIVKESQEFLEKYKDHIFKYFPKALLMRENFIALMTPEDIAKFLEDIITILRFEPWKYAESTFKLISKQLTDTEKKNWASFGYDAQYLETIFNSNKLKKVSRDGAGFWEFIVDQLSLYSKFIESAKVNSKDNSIYLEKKVTGYWEKFYDPGFALSEGKTNQNKNGDLTLKEYWKKYGILIVYEFYSFCFDYWSKLFLEGIKYKNLGKTYRYYDDLRIILDRISGSAREAEYQEYMKRYKELLSLLKQDKRGAVLPNKNEMTQDDKYWAEFMELIDDI